MLKNIENQWIDTVEEELDESDSGYVRQAGIPVSGTFTIGDNFIGFAVVTTGTVNLVGGGLR
ncbi:MULTISPECIES: hypothetical protein [unclassified Streptomyces]|uniref:hypothetical protein n=1 Tax=unclassified Streptomyces TaxID=2593676 RepID=UPI00190580F2|nr:hypothetical protein [Streptomyces sp. HSG2]